MRIINFKSVYIVAISLLIVGYASEEHKDKEPSISFYKMISWAGTGCKEGEGIVKHLKSGIIQVSFYSYQAGIGSTVGIKRTACSFVIPIKLPKGYQLSVVNAEWSGYIKGEGKIGRKYFMAGKPYSPSWKRSKYNEPGGKDFVIKDQSILNTTACGGLYILHINSNLRVMNSTSFIENKALKIKLSSKSCKENT